MKRISHPIFVGGFEGMSCRFVEDFEGRFVDLLRILRDKMRE